MKSSKFLPAHTHLPGGRAGEPRRLALDAVEWVSAKVVDAADNDLIEVRSTSGDLHRVRAADLRAAFPSLRRKRQQALAEAVK